MYGQFVNCPDQLPLIVTGEFFVYNNSNRKDTTMSLSAIIIKLIGIVLAVVGLSLLLSAVGVNFLGVGVSPLWLAIILGVGFIGAGVYLIRGSTIGL